MGFFHCVKEIDYDKDYNVYIVNILFNKNEIENIAYMFRNDCFDMIVNIEDRDIILSNYTKKKDINRYVDTLRNFYNTLFLHNKVIFFYVKHFFTL